MRHTTQTTMSNWPIKSFVLVSLLLHVSKGAINLARGKPTYQDTTYNNNTDQFGPQKAVDGRLDTFTSTEEQAESRWTVDLQAEYMIARVDIYNRAGYYERLSKIFVYSSTVSVPGTARYGDWTSHYYQHSAFDSISSVGFNPPITARHIRILSTNTTGLSITEVEVYEAMNIAQGRPAAQSSTRNISDLIFGAGNAVNGNYRDFSHTASRQPGWWKVDLQTKYSIREIELYNQDGVYHNLANVTIFTSAAVSTDGIAPTNSTPIWTFRHYQHEAYGTRGNVRFNPPIEAQHVAVHCAAAYYLALKEVVVYELNYALSQTATHTGNNPDYAASNAVDGLANTFSSTIPPDGNSNNWWKVSFSKQILFRRTRVYVRDGGCDGGPCASRLSDMHVLTVKSATDVSPNSDRVGDWEICYHSAAALGETFDVTCTDGKTPVTRQFSIKTNSGISVGLREVEVYGFELPELTDNIDGQTDSAICTSVTVSFLKWIQTMPGGQPPTRYEVKADGQINNVLHADVEGSRAITQFTGLNSNQQYTVSVTCYIQGVQCPGSTPSFVVRTACDAPTSPSNIQVSYEEVTHSSRQRWKCTATWQKSASDFDVTYETGGVISTQTDSPSAVFYIDGYQQYTFKVRAKSSDGNYSSFTTKNDTSGRLEPQFGPNQFTVNKKSFACVTLAWSKPLYPGGPVEYYRYKCGTEKWKNRTTNSSPSVDSCGHEPNTQIKCYLKAFNGLPTGSDEQIDVGSTHCAAPSASRNLSISSSAKYNNGRTMWRIEATWSAPSKLNCNGTIQYTYGTQGRTISQLRTSQMAVFYRDGNQTYHFVVKAKNSVGYSVVTETNGRSGVLKPQFGNKQLTVKGQNSSCVSIEWQEPQYPGGYITSYSMICGGKDILTQARPATLTSRSCGHQPHALVNCSLTATNSAGVSDPISSTGKTNCSDGANQCPPPPIISGALAQSVKDLSVGETVLYACEDGQAKLKGDLQLTCQLGENGPFWSGSRLVCSKGIWEGFGTVVGCLCLFLILLFTYSIIKQRQLRPNVGENQPEEKNLHTYEDVSTRPQPTYVNQSCVNMIEDETGFNGEYESVDQPQNVAPAYETLGMSKCGPDHVYEATQQ